jgi:hypothetical protein
LAVSPKVKTAKKSVKNDIMSQVSQCHGPPRGNHRVKVVARQIIAIQPFVQGALDTPSEVWSRHDESASLAQGSIMEAKNRQKVVKVFNKSKGANEICLLWFAL